MDMTVSPDLPAYVCYGIVLALGLFVAVGQLRKRLGGIVSVIPVARAWLLFGAYTAVPVVLFWLLDRTGAITDTSLFAAVLIAISYERIITGGNETLQAPGDVSSLWSPFVAYADKVTKSVLDREANEQRRLADLVVAYVAEDQARFTALRAVATSRSADVPAVEQALVAIDQLPGIGDGDRLERKARLLYGLMLSVPDYQYLLREKGVISNAMYWTRFKRIPKVVGTLAVIVASIALAILVVRAAYPDYQYSSVNYYSWRLQKPNSTATDQWRSRRALLTLVDTDATMKARATERLIYALQRPGLAIERVDLIVQILLESRHGQIDPKFARELVVALRASSLDARLRINDALKFLAKACAEKLDDQLDGWKPTDRESSTLLEDAIVRWDRKWMAGCNPA